jgi:hypothetical protein
MEPEPEPELKPLERLKPTKEELIHEQAIKDYNQRYPNLDPLMCSVLLKCPADLLSKLVDDPTMWVTPPATETVISDAITIN